MSLIATSLIMVGTALAQGIAKNVSSKRDEDAQGRVQDANKQFQQESADINLEMQKDKTAFDKKMFGEQSKIAQVQMAQQERGLKDAQAQAEGARKEQVMSGLIGGGDLSSRISRSQKNILRLGGGRGN